MLYNESADEYFQMFKEHNLPLCEPNMLISPDDLFRVNENTLIILLLNNGEDLFDDINDLALKEIKINVSF